MNQHLFAKIPGRRTVQLIVADLANRLAKAGPMSEAIALGLGCDWRLDLVRSGAPGFSFTSE
jgi:hypothetical protein